MDGAGGVHEEAVLRSVLGINLLQIVREFARIRVQVAGWREHEEIIAGRLGIVIVPASDVRGEVEEVRGERPSEREAVEVAVLLLLGAVAHAIEHPVATRGLHESDIISIA